MKIGELAERTGASVRSLRYYEQRGLLRSERTVGNQREYDHAAVDRVGLIRNLLAAGLSTETIDDVLPCMSEPANQTPRLTRTLLAERSRLDAEIARLEETRRLLDDVIAQAPRDTDSRAGSEP
ncbi:MerR family transcriptional regulator [Nocardioides sp. SR21]|uniref:MerR family transcriptional regulator n=1 Tax=Nocardioides sp. SR21 TaxID=2919501 RepID=UPI001FAAB0BB|nr:MerR family transcriptional regulator [Nocardioides sp. SR21]